MKETYRSRHCSKASTEAIANAGLAKEFGPRTEEGAEAVHCEGILKEGKQRKARQGV